MPSRTVDAYIHISDLIVYLIHRYILINHQLIYIHSVSLRLWKPIYTWHCKSSSVTSDYSESITDMLKVLKWETLEQRRLKARVTMGFRIIHGMVMIPANQLVPSLDKTRGHGLKYQQISARTNYDKGTFFPSFIPLWNSLPHSVTSAATLDGFNKKLADVHLHIPQIWAASFVTF